MRQQNQVFIFNDDELTLIKNTFAESEALLYTIRKVLLQFPLTAVERGMVKSFVTPEVIAVLRKRMLPEPSDDFPIGQLSSLWTTLTNDFKIKMPGEMMPLIGAKLTEIEYLKQQFEVLGDIDKAGREKLKLADLCDVEERSQTAAFEDMTAYLFLLGYIDPMLLFIKSIAGTKTETVDEQKKRMQRDSNK